MLVHLSLPCTCLLFIRSDRMACQCQPLPVVATRPVALPAVPWVSGSTGFDGELNRTELAEL